MPTVLAPLLKLRLLSLRMGKGALPPARSSQKQAQDLPESAGRKTRGALLGQHLLLSVVSSTLGNSLRPQPQQSGLHGSQQDVGPPLSVSTERSLHLLVCRTTRLAFLTIRRAKHRLSAVVLDRLSCNGTHWLVSR